MGKTVYSRNPSTSKGTVALIQSPKAPEETSEFITRIPTRPLKQSRAWPSPKPSNTSRMSSLTDVAFLTPPTSAVSVEPDKLLSSARPSVDGPKSPWRSCSDWSTTSNPMLMPKTLRTSPSITSKSIELQRDAVVLTEPTVVLGPISLPKHTSRSTQLRR